SAMSQMKAMFDSGFSGLREALGVKAARAEEAERGHIKGINFEDDLYKVVAEMGRQFGDQTELVRGTPGINNARSATTSLRWARPRGRLACASSSRSRTRPTRRRRQSPSCSKRRKTARPSAAFSSSQKAASP